MIDTIFALSSGAPPAALGIIRVSGPAAGSALQALGGKLPEPRRASLARLRDEGGILLDEALVLWLPGPRTATGEDMVELHCHGGRAVIAAVERTLAARPGLRRAQPGEFTRRAFANGRIDLAEAEGLADLLSAETEIQRSAALLLAGGSFSRRVEDWRDRLLIASAALEAALDFADEEDAAALPPGFAAQLDLLAGEIDRHVQAPRAETLREGFRVVIAGPPNAGKSTLFNALVEAEAAITAPIPGTTRDVLTRPVALAGVPFLFVDTAGLRSETADPVEAIGIARAEAELERSDLVLWLGPEGHGPVGSWEIAAQCDRVDAPAKFSPRHRISATTGQGLDGLRNDLLATARAVMPRPGQVALNSRQHQLLTEACARIGEAAVQLDPLLAAEALRQARVAFDSLLGRATTEDMLDTLFGRFCIGK